MARRRKIVRPADPLDIARRRAAAREAARDPATWGIDATALDLPANAAVERAARTRRQDVFDLFRARGKLSPDALEAVRRLQADIAVLHRTHAGGSAFAPRIDRSRRPDGFTDARLRAGGRIEAVLALSGAATGRVIVALCEEEAVHGRSGDWRETVARETGERLPDGQGAILRLACENLAGAYATLDRISRR
ncbi:MAG: hypothetical protein ABI376_01665 [Caulobacteraceae bacterium]